MRSYLMKQILVVLLVAVISTVAVQPEATYAYTPYSTNYKDGYDQLVWTQSAYNPVAALGRDIYIPDPRKPDQLIFSPLKQAQDLFIDDKDHIYIADTGNNRIVHLDEQGKLVRILEVKESPLNKPQGLFIDPKGTIYIADTGNKRVVSLDKDGRFIREFKRPESKFLPASFKFDPVKLVVDKRGFLYIAALGGYQGLVQLDPAGNFQGFFGANTTSFSLIDMFKRLVYTREMYVREISKLPGSIASVTTDQDGMVYTVSKDIEYGQIKKLNIAGLDQLESKGDFAKGDKKTSYGETAFFDYQHRVPLLADLTVDSDGNITVIDSKLKVVNQYDSSGNLLFFWWGDDNAVTTKLGLVKTPTAITTNSKNELFILDGENNFVQSFRLSEFGALVHKANHLTQEGKYEESEAPWAEVNRLNAYYTPAILGLAKAAYKKGDYTQAQQLFYEAGQAQGYSDAFWQNRLVWFQKNFGVLMNVAIALFIFLFVLEKWSKKSGWRQKWRQRKHSERLLVQQLKQAFYILKHPIDGFGALRHENKAGAWSSLIIWVLALASFCLMQAGISFIFNPAVILEVNLLTVAIQFLAIWLAWVISNYLISSILRGEGRFRDVVYGSTYALFPLVLVGLPLTLISNVMTLNESSIYNFLYIGLFTWIGLLLFWKVQSMQNYSIGETSVSVVLSMVTMTVLGVLIFITVGLTKELTDFGYSVFQEVTIR
ncbi:YIP1 family protein [Paenibacillus agricola]|uniref:Nuclease PIN n=1 Tax=Paenibacillus agricola TaxID=2716264 RepID=A0ABX0J1J1_9BACL|nr:YIP1 family protein [Paenibacillus agricola]NHN29813.1 nuclease PIN [Paenibacillus agricola]